MGQVGHPVLAADNTVGAFQGGDGVTPADIAACRLLAFDVLLEPGEDCITV